MAHTSIDLIVFDFDDQQINVDGALAVGMQARRVNGIAGVREALGALGLAP